MERRQVRDEPEVETDVHTWSVLPEALTGEHTHAPVKSCKLASLFISLMWVCVSQLVYMCWHMCACLSSDVQGLCLRCLASYASLLSLCAFESVYAWISSASDPCAKCQISPQSPVRAHLYLPVVTLCHETLTWYNKTVTTVTEQHEKAGGRQLLNGSKQAKHKQIEENLNKIQIKLKKKKKKRKMLTI